MLLTEQNVRRHHLVCGHVVPVERAQDVTHAPGAQATVIAARQEERLEE